MVDPVGDAVMRPLRHFRRQVLQHTAGCWPMLFSAASPAHRPWWPMPSCWPCLAGSPRDFQLSWGPGCSQETLLQKPGRFSRHQYCDFWAVCGESPSCMKSTWLVSAISERWRTPPFCWSLVPGVSEKSDEFKSGIFRVVVIGDRVSNRVPSESLFKNILFEWGSTALHWGALGTYSWWPTFRSRSNLADVTRPPPGRGIRKATRGAPTISSPPGDLGDSWGSFDIHTYLELQGTPIAGGAVEASPRSWPARGTA